MGAQRQLELLRHNDNLHEYAKKQVSIVAFLELLLFHTSPCPQHKMYVTYVQQGEINTIQIFSLQFIQI